MKYSVNCKTEIIATTGPSLHTVEQLCYAMSLGIRNFRLALSSRERDVCQYIRNIRIAEKRSGSKAEVLLDFPADRPRTAEMEPTLLKENCIYVFCDTDKKSLQIKSQAELNEL